MQASRAVAAADTVVLMNYFRLFDLGWSIGYRNLAASNQVLRLPARNPLTKTTCIRAAGVGGFKK